MTPFEYVVVLLSIILGLGITVVLTGVAGLIREWRHVTAFWPYFIWVALVFVMHIHEWWIIYEWRTMLSWSMAAFLLIILYPILLFILANLLLPNKWRKKDLNLKNYYFRLYPKFFLSTLALIATAVLSDLMITGRTLIEQTVKIFLFALILALFIARTENPRVHGALAMFLLIVMIISMFVSGDELIIR